MGDFQEGKHTKVMCKDVQDDYYSAVTDDDDDDRECREYEEEDEGEGEGIKGGCFVGSKGLSSTCNGNSIKNKDRNRNNNNCSSNSNNKHNSSNTSSSCAVNVDKYSNSVENVQNSSSTVVQVIENDMLSNNAGRAGDVYRSLRQR